MPVVTLTKPMTLNCGGGWIERYGVGEYWFEGMAAYDAYVMLHAKAGRPELDATPLTNPGPPVIGQPSM